MTIETARDTAAAFFNQLDDANKQLADMKSELESTKVALQNARLDNANLSNQCDANARAAETTRTYIEGLLDAQTARANKYEALTISLAKGTQLFSSIVKAAMDDLYDQAAKALAVEPAGEQPVQQKAPEDALDDGIAKIAANFGAGRPEVSADAPAAQQTAVPPTVFAPQQA